MKSLSPVVKAYGFVAIAIAFQLLQWVLLAPRIVRLLDSTAQTFGIDASDLSGWNAFYWRFTRWTFTEPLEKAGILAVSWFAVELVSRRLPGNREAAIRGFGVFVMLWSALGLLAFVACLEFLRSFRT